MIEISVTQPDDYDHREEASTIESTVYLGVEEARKFAVALQTAIVRAEAELTRRGKMKPKARTRHAGRSPTKLATRDAAATALSVKTTEPRTKPRPKPALAASAVTKPVVPSAGRPQMKEKPKRADLAATLRELGHRS